MNASRAGSDHGVSSTNDTATAFTTRSSPNRSPVSKAATRRFDRSSSPLSKALIARSRTFATEQVKEDLVEVSEVLVVDLSDFRTNGEEERDEVVRGHRHPGESDRTAARTCRPRTQADGSATADHAPYRRQGETQGMLRRAPCCSYLLCLSPTPNAWVARRDGRDLHLRRLPG